MVLTHIPYRGSGPALNDAVAGQVPLVADNLPSALPFIRSGQLVPLAVAAPARLAQMPQVPTFRELGLPEVNREAFYGLQGPKNLRPEVVQRVSAAARQALADPTVRRVIEEAGAQIVAGTPEQFGREIAAEYAVYRRVAAERRIWAD